MSQISDFADKVEEKFTIIGDGVDGIVSSIGGINTDVQNLKKQIADLQSAPGAFTPEDQARVDKIQSGVDALAVKTTAAASAAKELDAQTETAPTPEPA